MLEEKADIGLFDKLAPNYDRFNHLTSAGIDRVWRRIAVRRMAAADKVLDVAVGTADLAIEMVRRGKAGQVEGIDLSTEMMHIGEAKISRAGLSDRIVLHEGNALAIDAADGCYDALTCAYGVRNFSDLDKGLQEFYRVLRKGGEVIILEFSFPTNRLIAWAYDFYFNHVMTLIGRLMTRDKGTFRYFYHSVKNFPKGEDMLRRMKAAGFRDATAETLTFGISTIYKATK